MRDAAPTAARWAVERSDEYLCGAGLTEAYSRVSKQAGAFPVHSSFRTCFTNVIHKLAQGVG